MCLIRNCFLSGFTYTIFLIVILFFSVTFFNSSVTKAMDDDFLLAADQIIDIYPQNESTESSFIFPPETLHEIREKVKNLTTNPDIPSIAVGVAIKGEIIWQEAFGYADLDNEIPATAYTKYSVASVTKPITATGVLMLADRGLVDLDEPINRYLNETKISGFAADADRATVRRVLNHTSGLPLHYHFFYDDFPINPPPMEESIRRYGILTYQPGERYLYSNIGYGVLDHVIRSVSGKSYTSFLREEIFEPLGMQHSSVGMASPEPEKYAVRYGNDLERLPFYDFDHRGASAVFSSVHDLLRFGMFSLGNSEESSAEILSDSMRTAMHSKSSQTGMSQFSGYGLGWSITEHESGLKEVWHSGGMAGVRTVLKLVPESDLVVVVLHNSNSSQPLAIADEIVKMFHPEQYQTRPPSMVRQNELNFNSLVGSWSGEIKTYSGERQLKMVVEENGDIDFQFEDSSPVPLARPYVDEFGFLRGIFFGELGTLDTSHKLYILYLNARPEGERFYGSVTAISIGEDREGFALSSFIELEKEE